MNIPNDNAAEEAITRGTTHDTPVSSDSLASYPETVLGPAGSWTAVKMHELWEYRDLLFFLTWREVMVRYKQAALGVAWAVLQPLLTMVIFTVIFSRLANLPSDGHPYPVFTLVALLPWQLFATAITRSGSSLVGNANLLSKVYFPRLVIPLSAVLSSAVDFLISFVLLIGMMVWYHITPTWAVLTLPLFILLALMTALAVGLWLSALNVEYRDIQYAIPFIVQIWMYASPVAYSDSLMPSGIWHTLFGLNPMAGVIQGFRWALLGGRPPDYLFGISVLAVCILLVTGYLNFKRMERTFADVV